MITTNVYNFILTQWGSNKVNILAQTELQLTHIFLNVTYFGDKFKVCEGFIMQFFLTPWVYLSFFIVSSCLNMHRSLHHQHIVINAFNHLTFLWKKTHFPLQLKFSSKHSVILLLKHYLVWRDCCGTCIDSSAGYFGLRVNACMQAKIITLRS